jgi:hypothetical protein
LLKTARTEATMKTTTEKIPMLFLLSSLAFGCASTRHASLDVAGPERGDVLIHGHALKAVVAGPVSFHAYAASAGGRLFIADDVTGTDADCQLAQSGAGATLVADRIASVTVGAGKIACLSTSGARSFEMLWHTQKAVRSLVVAGNP